jgi:hypothetical protein
MAVLGAGRWVGGPNSDVVVQARVPPVVRWYGGTVVLWRCCDTVAKDYWGGCFLIVVGVAADVVLWFCGILILWGTGNPGEGAADVCQYILQYWPWKGHIQPSLSKYAATSFIAQ